MRLQVSKIQYTETRLSYKAVLYGLGRLNFKHLLLLHKIKFYKVQTLVFEVWFLHNDIMYFGYH